MQLDPVVGHEQAGKRPALILSNDGFNDSGSGLVVVLPITSRERPYATRVLLDPPEGGVRQRSWIMGEQIRTVSMHRLLTCWGVARPVTLDKVVRVVRHQIEGL